MRKNSSNQTIWHRLRRHIAGALVLTLVLGLLPGLALPAQAADHWAMPYAQQLMDWGVMRGDTSGALRLGSSITRAEFVAMMNRAYGYDELNGMPFTDVSSRDWFYDDIDIGYNIGYFKGTGATTASPNAPLTREQAAVLLSRNLMLRGTTGETLGFSDSRTLSDWSRGLIGAAVSQGVISGYEDGSFKPQRNITRGEVAAMLVRAIGTPISEKGEHTLGSVYGNVTINTSGVTLRNTVIAGNLYLTGGIDLGDVLLENVEVLGQIVVSGAGESSSSQSSVILRNVTADEMVVDSIANQFVSVRAEGHTDIPVTSVRTNAYVEDASTDGHGLALIHQDGEEGTLLQVAGNLKEIVNFTPKSTLQIARGYAEKVTVDENATESKVIIDNGARVGELNLDVATEVTGGGDIKNLNVAAPGCKVEMLPDKITIRPGITGNINGTEMDSVTADESSADPKLMAGYPAVKNVAPNSATLVFSTNKAGTVHWAISAVSDGSVSEKDLLEPPVYGGKILKAGTVKTASSNSEYTAQVNGLTPDGSYYVSAILVDGRDNRSPVKVAAFTTPDNTVPAFTSGYPVMTKTSVDLAQVTVMTNKSCRLYYALLPSGSTAPTANEFKTGAVSGNLGYGSLSVVKNVTHPIQVNAVKLDEVTKYDLYLWLVDHDGVKSSAVKKLTFTTDDNTPPIVTNLWQSDFQPTSAGVTYTVNEPATLYWAIVKEGDEAFITRGEHEEGLTDKLTKIKVESGAGALKKGSSNASKAEAEIKFAISALNSKVTGTNSYTLYYVAKDKAGNYSNEVKFCQIQTTGAENPTVKQEFTKYNGDKKNEPMADTDIRLVFSESVKGGPDKGENVFLDLYAKVETAQKAYDDGDKNDTSLKMNLDKAREELSAVLYDHIKLMCVPAVGSSYEVSSNEKLNVEHADNIIDYRYAKVEYENGSVVVRFPTVKNADGTITGESALRLKSGAEYYFQLIDIYGTGFVPKRLVSDDTRQVDLEHFKTVFAQVNVNMGTSPTIKAAVDSSGNPIGPTAPGAPKDGRIDFNFVLNPSSSTSMVEEAMCWDMLIWTDTTMSYDLYSRTVGIGTDGGTWTYEGSSSINVTGAPDGFAYHSLRREFQRDATGRVTFNPVKTLNADVEYAIRVTSLGDSDDSSAWNRRVTVKIMVVAGSSHGLSNLSNGSYQTDWETAQKDDGVSSIGNPDPRIIRKQFSDTEPPQLVENYPSIAAGDIGAEIDVMLDRPGQVFYVAVPLNNFKKGADDFVPTGQLKFSDLQGVTSYTTPVVPTMAGWGLKADDTSKVQQTEEGLPLPTGSSAVPQKGGKKATENATAGHHDRMMLSAPGVNTITGGKFSGKVRYGSTPSMEANVGYTITLEDLDPNTLYYVYLVTKGTSAIYSRFAECYAFITQESVRPNINASISGTNVNIEVDRTTDLNYILVSSGSEDAAIRADFWGNTAMTDHKVAPADDADVANVKTVLDALTTPHYNKNTREYDGSVFDHYANARGKDTVAGLIRSQEVSGTTVVMTGSKRVTEAGNGGVANRIPCTGMQDRTFYTFLAVGKSVLGSGDAFRAVRPVQKADTEPPMITSAIIAVTKWAEDGKGNKLPQIAEGTISIVFSEGLYSNTQSGTEQKTLPIDGCRVATSGTGVHDTEAAKKYAALSGIITTSSNSGVKVRYEKSHSTAAAKAPISVIELNVANVQSGFGISFDGSVCDKEKNGLDRSPLTVKVQITKVPGTGTKDIPVEYVASFIVPAAWDARTDK